MPSSSDNSRPWLACYEKLNMPADVPFFSAPLCSALDSAARDFPGRPAVCSPDYSMNYGELLTAAEEMAAGLRRAGCRRGDRVAVMLPNSIRSVVAFWGILKSGCTCVMLNPGYMEGEIVARLHDSGAKCVIFDEACREKVSVLSGRIPASVFIVSHSADAVEQPVDSPADACSQGVLSWSGLFDASERLSCPSETPESDAAILQYTSGTTGVPKGVMLTHANLGTNARQVVCFDRLSKTVPERFLGVMPFFHVYGLMYNVIVPAFVAGAVIPVAKYAPRSLLKVIREHRPTVFPGAPAIYGSLLRQKGLAESDLSCIRLCICGSAPLPGEILRRFRESSGAALLEGYGLSEASPVTHHNPDDVSLRKANSIGIPVPGTDARIVDARDGRTILGPGKVGELVVRGPQVMRGYWGRPAETGEVLRGGWLYTGDLAYMDEDGFFFIKDRKKDMAIVGGFNVYPKEVDDVLMANPDIEEAATVGIPSPLRGETLKAYVVPRPGSGISAPMVKAWCRKRLAGYKVPRSVEFRDFLPKNAVGKVLRRVLRDEEISRGLAAGQGSPLAWNRNASLPQGGPASRDLR